MLQCMYAAQEHLKLGGMRGSVKATAKTVCICRCKSPIPMAIGLLWIHVLNVVLDVLWNCLSKVPCRMPALNLCLGFDPCETATAADSQWCILQTMITPGTDCIG